MFLDKTFLIKVVDIQYIYITQIIQFALYQLLINNEMMDNSKKLKVIMYTTKIH